ncbi:MAG TPA: DMT family transporter [Thermohalobaculum sp.]|nr:DMT family transporter [Thermohalobaculum sp.]
MERREEVKGHAAMALFAVLISGSYSLGHRAAPFIDPAALTAVRFVLAALILWAAVRALRGGVRPAHLAAPWRYFALGGLFSVYFVLMFVGLRLSEPVPMAAVFTLTPIMAAGFGWALVAQRPRRRMAWSIGLACAGALWVIFRADLGRLMAFEVGLGERIFFVGCAAHALYTVLVRRLNRGEPVLVFTFGTTVAGAILLTLWALPALLATDWTALPAIVWIVLLYLAVFTTAGTFFLLQFATMRLPAGTVMAYGYLVPSFTILWEGLSGRGWAPWAVLPGIALTVAAMAVLASGRSGAPRARPAE